MNKVKAENSYASPVKTAHNKQNKGKSVYYCHINHTFHFEFAYAKRNLADFDKLCIKSLCGNKKNKRGKF